MHWLCNRNLATYYIIRRVTPVEAGAIVSSPTATTMSTPIALSVGRTPIRGKRFEQDWIH
jgi:hypothetical protein